MYWWCLNWISMLYLYLWSDRTTVWSQTTWRLWWGRWERRTTAWTAPCRSAGRTLPTTARSPISPPMNSWPPWSSWSEPPRVCWPGSTGRRAPFIDVIYTYKLFTLPFTRTFCMKSLMCFCVGRGKDWVLFNVSISGTNMMMQVHVQPSWRPFYSLQFPV